MNRLAQPTLRQFHNTDRLSSKALVFLAGQLPMFQPANLVYRLTTTCCIMWKRSRQSCVRSGTYLEVALKSFPTCHGHGLDALELLYRELSAIILEAISLALLTQNL